MLRKGQSKVGGIGRRGWPGDVHQQLVRHRRLNLKISPTMPFCCHLIFAIEPFSSYEVCFVGRKQLSFVAIEVLRVGERDHTLSC
jgi:hypothetical protein